MTDPPAQFSIGTLKDKRRREPPKMNWRQTINMDLQTMNKQWNDVMRVAADLIRWSLRLMIIIISLWLELFDCLMCLTTSQTANLSDHNQRSRRQQVGDCVSGYWRWNDWSEWSACNNQGCNQQDLRTRIRFCPDNPGENETESELCAEAPHCNSAMAPIHPKVEEAKSDSLSLSVALEALLGMFIILVAAFTIYTVVTVIQRRRKEAKEEQTDISDRLSDEDVNKTYSFVSDTQGMIEMSSAPFATDVPADVTEMMEFSATPSAAGTASYAQGMPDWLVAPSTSTVAASEGSGWDFEVDPVESESEIK